MPPISWTQYLIENRGVLPEELPEPVTVIRSITRLLGPNDPRIPNDITFTGFQDGVQVHCTNGTFFINTNQTRDCAHNFSLVPYGSRIDFRNFRLTLNRDDWPRIKEIVDNATEAMIGGMASAVTFTEEALRNATETAVQGVTEVYNSTQEIWRNVTRDIVTILFPTENITDFPFVNGTETATGQPDREGWWFAALFEGTEIIWLLGLSIAIAVVYYVNENRAHEVRENADLAVEDAMGARVREVRQVVEQGRLAARTLTISMHQMRRFLGMLRAVFIRPNTPLNQQYTEFGRNFRALVDQRLGEHGIIAIEAPPGADAEQQVPIGGVGPNQDGRYVAIGGEDEPATEQQVALEQSRAQPLMLLDAPQVVLPARNDEPDWMAEFLDERPETQAPARAAEPTYQNVPIQAVRDLLRMAPLPPVRNRVRFGDRVDVIPASPDGTISSISLIGQDGSLPGSSTIDDIVATPSSTAGMLDSGFVSPVIVPTVIDLDSTITITDVEDSQETVLNSTLNITE